MRAWVFVLGIGLLIGCYKSSNKPSSSFFKLNKAPKGFPEVIHPADNQFTPDRWKLGKKLFFDPQLSGDSSISCASCHLPQNAFSDVVAISPGVDGLLAKRNASTLANLAYHPYFTRDGGVNTLEKQVLIPIHEKEEMNFNIVLITERLADHKEYQELSEAAYDQPLDHFVITRAIACFERTLLSGNSQYDKYTFQNQVFALNEAELRGRDLFFSERTNCFSCHAGFNFTNYSFENNGLYEVYVDEGKFRVTNDDKDKYKFKVPTLRNIELTGPYMHDGSIHSLAEVIEHYNSGGKDHYQKSEMIKPLNLTTAEKEDLLKFLLSLTDHEFIENQAFRKD